MIDNDFMTEVGTDFLPIPGSILPDPEPDAVYLPPSVIEMHITYLSFQPTKRILLVETPGMTRGEVAEKNAGRIALGKTPLYLSYEDSSRLLAPILQAREDARWSNRIKRFGQRLLGHTD